MSSLQDSRDVCFPLVHRVHTLCYSMSPRWGSLPSPRPSPTQGEGAAAHIFVLTINQKVQQESPRPVGE